MLCSGQLGALAVVGAAILCGDDVVYGGVAARAILAAHAHAGVSYHGGGHHPGFGDGYVGQLCVVLSDALTGRGVVEELKTTAIELQDLVQAKVGTTAFAKAYNRIRQGAVSVQQARRVARVTQVRPEGGGTQVYICSTRVVQATTDPEAAAKRKLARNAMKKESRKRKHRAFACVFVFIAGGELCGLTRVCSEGRGRVKRRREA